MKIYKYEIPIKPSVELELPEGFNPLCVQMQEERVILWAIVSPDAPTSSRVFRVYGTGFNLQLAGSTYLGTVQTEGGLVWHVFMEGL